jgi:hypothetical protein
MANRAKKSQTSWEKKMSESQSEVRLQEIFREGIRSHTKWLKLSAESVARYAEGLSVPSWPTWSEQDILEASIALGEAINKVNAVLLSIQERREKKNG